ncbi:MAG: iron dicitrate transport regulator FecR [Sphingobium sp.]|nr:iron dicitrate transport regulator FecR [Sphingobium sp.]|tara:strand:+ start:241 stop:1227 length:987 start_codon:yes stop_codon:yes gene_type:complete
MREAAQDDTRLEPLNREALAWIARLSSGEVTVADAKELARWRASSEAHEAAFRDALTFRNALADVGHAMKLDLDAAGVSTLRPASNTRWTRRSFLTGGGGAVAASIAGAWLAIDPPMDLWPSYAEWSADYRTATGERRTIHPLAGVDVQMAARTSLARTGAGAGLKLVAGEAFVEVKRDAPFAIRAQDGMVQASRAAFNVRNLDGEVCVTCLDGELRVESGDKSATFREGRQLTYKADGFGPVIKVDAERTMAWRTGRLIFQGEALSQVIDEINRYRSGRIILTNTALERRPVNAVFHLDQIDDAVSQIEYLAVARARHFPGGVVLIG